MDIALSVNPRNQIALSTSMRQSMEILQLSSIDLYDYIQERSADNPLIEIVPGHSPRRESGSGRTRTSNASNDWWLNVNQPCYPSIEEVIGEQLRCLNLTSVEKQLCAFITGCLDDRGYLTQSAEWIADYKNVPLELVGKALHIIQSLEPAGLAAASLEECLLLQLPSSERENTLIGSLIRHELRQIASGKIKPLARKYDVDPPVIQEAIDWITSLNPKPGALFGQDKPQYLIPDLSLRKANGTFEIYLEDDHLPSISMNPQYSKLLMEKRQPREVSLFLRKKRQEARWMIQSLDFRKSMLLKICAAIFDKQREFCERGPSAIQPLSMRMIAEELGIHDSTVSRAVNHKYMMTPWGLFELKHFFSASLKQADGETVSALTAKERIKEIVRTEDKNAPLSDIKISEKLQQEGILISRRTVTKYREQLHIGSTAQRKRYETLAKT